MSDVASWLQFGLYWVALVAILIGYSWTITMFVLSTRYERFWRRQPPGNEADFLWVFLVPALNEEVTIADSVARLRQVEASHKVILVINDGSQDGTAQVLGESPGPTLGC